MNKPKVMKMNTGGVQKWGHPFIVLFAVIGSPISAYVAMLESSWPENMAVKALVLIVAIGAVTVGCGFLYSSMRSIYRIEIDGSVLTGSTFFGSQKRIRLEDVKSLKIGPQNNCILQTESGERFGITGAIDYDGFIKDYILLNLPPGAEIDELGIAKLRANEDHWLYARRPPRDADYPADYLIWLEGVVRDQKLALMKKGVLSRNRSYEGRTNLYQSGP